MFTGCCSMMTVIAFIMGQLYESQWKWDFDYDDYDAELSKYLPNKFDVNTAFQLGEIRLHVILLSKFFVTTCMFM